MNKKVSTLLTASLLMMSPVFGSIFAQTQIPVSSATDGDTYVVKATQYWNNPTDGWKGHVNPYYLSIDDEGNVSLELHSAYTQAEVWTVNVSGPQHNIYKFTSSKGQTFTAVAGTTTSSSEFVLNTTGSANTLEWYTTAGDKYMVGHESDMSVVGLKYDGNALNPVTNVVPSGAPSFIVALPAKSPSLFTVM